MKKKKSQHHEDGVCSAEKRFLVEFRPVADGGLGGGLAPPGDVAGGA